MRNFVWAVGILLALAVLTAGNAWLTRKTAREIETAILASEDAEDIKGCIALVEKKRSVLHLSQRHTRIDALIADLKTAYCYSAEGDKVSAQAHIALSLDKVREFYSAEEFSFYNIL